MVVAYENCCWVPLPNDMYQISIEQNMFLQNHHPKSFASDTPHISPPSLASDFTCVFPLFFVFSTLFWTKTFMNEFSNITQQVVHWGNGLGSFSFLFSHLIGKEGVDLWLTWLDFFRISDTKYEEYDKMI